MAVHRIPLKQNIVYKHSYCPNCNHKLEVLDLLPIFSYIFLKGRCRHCREPIRARYFLIEVLSGIVFVLFALSIKIDFTNFEVDKLVYLISGLIYISTLFIIAGIDREKILVEKSVLLVRINKYINIYDICIYSRKH